MDPKLTLLFVLIGTIVTLSRLGDHQGGLRRSAVRHWRRIVPGWRRG